ncbi:hypothetical protein [Gordonia zhaorongruii]|uniref:hypothetical protein n=1 Tax=Gordonia zhaorongruii TaxID=2597659 RepID=UPI001047BC39|nr:hypothetical protein [Gordonia zhaorongruii]
MGELAYEATLWGIRGQVARDAARELEELARALTAVVGRNYFGVGCVEGSQLFQRLSVTIADGSRSIQAAGQQSVHLAQQCAVASDSLAEADQHGQVLISGTPER